MPKPTISLVTINNTHRGVYFNRNLIDQVDMADENAVRRLNSFVEKLAAKGYGEPKSYQLNMSKLSWNQVQTDLFAHLERKAPSHSDSAYITDNVSSKLSERIESAAATIRAHVLKAATAFDKKNLDDNVTSVGANFGSLAVAGELIRRFSENQAPCLATLCEQSTLLSGASQVGTAALGVGVAGLLYPFVAKALVSGHRALVANSDFYKHQDTNSIINEISVAAAGHNYDTDNIPDDKLSEIYERVKFSYGDANEDMLNVLLSSAQSEIDLAVAPASKQHVNDSNGLSR